MVPWKLFRRARRHQARNPDDREVQPGGDLVKYLFDLTSSTAVVVVTSRQESMGRGGGGG